MTPTDRLNYMKNGMRLLRRLLLTLGLVVGFSAPPANATTIGTTEVAPYSGSNSAAQAGSLVAHSWSAGSGGGTQTARIWVDVPVTPLKTLTVHAYAETHLLVAGGGQASVCLRISDGGSPIGSDDCKSTSGFIATSPSSGVPAFTKVVNIGSTGGTRRVELIATASKNASPGSALAQAEVAAITWSHS